MRRLLIGLALLLAAPGIALPLPVTPSATSGGGGGGGTPAIGNKTGTSVQDDAAGTAVVTPTVSNLPGCTWSIAANGGYFAQASGGAITKSAANVPGGTYTPATTCSLTSGGQTVTVSTPTSIVVQTALGPLSLGSTTSVANQPFSTTITGLTSGSSPRSATSSDGTTLTVSGSTLSGTFTAQGTPTVNVTETLAGAAHSPRTSTFNFNILSALLNAPWRDDFLTGNGTLNNRTFGNWTYNTYLDSTNAGSTNAALQVTTASRGTLAGTSGHSHAHGSSVAAAGTNNYMLDRLLGATSTTPATLEADVSANGTTVTKWGISPLWGFNVGYSTVVNDSTVTSGTILAEIGRSGDIYELRRVTYNGTDFGQVRVNGRLVQGGSAYNIASTTSSVGYTITAGGTSGTTLTITSGNGFVSVGDHAVKDGKDIGTVVSQLTGTTGGTGTYQLSASSSVSTWTTFGLYSDVLHVTAVSSGTVASPMTPIFTPQLIPYATITSQIGGTAGGVGDYRLSNRMGPIASATVPLSLGLFPLGSVPANGRHGWLGNALSAAVDSHEAGDMSTMSRLVVIRAARVAPMESNGTIILQGSFEYTGTNPLALKSEIHLASDNSIVSGTAGQAVTFAIDSATKTGTFALAAFTPASVSTQYWARIYREDAQDTTGAAAIIAGDTGYFTPGYIITAMGQSLIANAESGTTTVTWATPSPTPWSWLANSGHPYTIVNGNAVSVAGSNRPVPALIDTVGPTFSNATAMYMTSAIGGSFAIDRAPGGSQYTAIYNALQQNGLRATFSIHNDGQSDSGQIVNYSNLVTQTYPGLWALSGKTWPVFFSPAGAVWAGDNGTVETFRRYQGFELLTVNANYLNGGFLMGVQHVDSLHLNGDGFGEMMRLYGLNACHKFNPTLCPYDRLGPFAVSASKLSATQVSVTFNLNGASDLVPSAGLGTNGKQDQYNGGMRFGTAVGPVANFTKADGTTQPNTITTEVYPNAAPTFSAPTGGFVTVTWTFPAGTFTGTAYVGGPFGSNPFNRTNDSTVNASLGSLGSMLLGTYSGENSLPEQPYWQTNGNDYMAAP